MLLFSPESRFVIIDSILEKTIADLEKFQGVPRTALDQLLPSKAGPTKPLAKASNPTATNSQTPKPPISKSKPPIEMPSKPSPANAPTNGIVQRVMKIVSEEAGVELAELGPSSEFADHGIDSLLSLTISGRIQEELRLELSPTLFVDCPTVKDLTNFLGASEGDITSPSSSSDDEPIFTPETDESSSETDASSVTGSSDDVLDTIRAMIAEETGVAPADLHPSTSFSELGMDSLLTLTIMGKLQEELAMDLPQTLLADNDTLKEVEKTLGLEPRNSNKPSSNTSVLSILPHSIGPEPDSPPHATSVLLQGSPQTATKTLFLLPDGAGSATSYSSLPKISPDTTVYGLNCPWQKSPQDMKFFFLYC